MQKSSFLFLLLQIFTISCEKAKNIETLTPQEDSLKTAMSTRFTSQQIDAKYEERLQTKLVTDSVLALALPPELLGMKRDTISVIFENHTPNSEFKGTVLWASYKKGDSSVKIGFSDCSDKFSSLTIKTTMIMETEYVNKILENGFLKSQVYKGHILRTKQTTENGQLQSNIKLQLKERYFVDIYGTNISVEKLKLVIPEIKYQELPD